jgi:hypothetical protein
MAGLKINFTKSEVILINGDDDRRVQLADTFNCKIGFFPIKYLGVSVSPCRLRVKDWKPLEEKGGRKLAVWKGGTLSYAGRTTLINSSLSGSFTYHMSMYLLPKTTTKKLDKQRRTFFWQGGSTKKKYRLIRWEIICKSKKKGGLGIKDIRKMNISLLCKWWWRLEKEHGVWQDIVKAKYLQHDGVRSVKHRINDSHVWTDLLKIKHIYLNGRKIETKNGQHHVMV